jgi:hypothetical protein
VSSSSPLFRFVQVEFPWPLGPPDGRYLVRPPAPTPPALAEAAASHVLVFATLGAPERRRLAGRRRTRDAEPEPAPAPVATGRATIIDAGDPVASAGQARSWLDAAGEDELAGGLRMLNRALHAFRLVTADPYLLPVARRQAITARVGFGAGEQVADGLWTAARELVATDARLRRAKLLSPQARLAAVLGARELPLVCEELALRARLDLDHARPREAALQLLVALDAAIAELAADPHAALLADRLTGLRGLREGTAGAAQAALSGPLDPEHAEMVSLTLTRVEAALRARAAAGS